MAAVARSAAAAAFAGREQQRSRPGVLAAAELKAKATSQWALLEAADARAYDAEMRQRKEVCGHKLAVNRTSTQTLLCIACTNNVTVPLMTLIAFDRMRSAVTLRPDVPRIKLADARAGVLATTTHR